VDGEVFVLGVHAGDPGDEAEGADDQEGDGGNGWSIRP
jgi:hypothetical protein